MSQLLLNRLLSAFPQTFVSRLLERQVALYRQSLDQALSDQPWGPAEGFGVLPHIRRALWETDLRQNAFECGLKTFDRPHLGLNSSCVNVKAGNIVLTEHFVTGPNEFVRDAESRKQNAGVNRFLNHYIDARLLTNEVPALTDRPVYVNLLHGCAFPSAKKTAQTIDVSTCFIHLAIPAADERKYLAGCNWSVQELLQHYAVRPATAVEPTAKINDEARPKRKQAS